MMFLSDGFATSMNSQVLELWYVDTTISGHSLGVLCVFDNCYIC